MEVWRVVVSTHLVETRRRCSLEGEFQRLEGIFTVFLGFNFHQFLAHALKDQAISCQVEYSNMLSATMVQQYPVQLK